MNETIFSGMRHSRRRFLFESGLGCGSLALTTLLHQEGLLQAGSSERPTHYPPKVKSVIWLFMTGGPSQVDTYDYKPELQKRDGQPLAGSDPKTGFFTTSGKCLKSPFAWKQRGSTGSWASDLFPHTNRHIDDMAFIHSCHLTANNHAPASMQLTGGVVRPGYPSIGAWVTYGLGSMNDSLPSFVVMHDTKPRGDDGIWSPGFLPKNYQALVLDSRRREEIANLVRSPAMNEKQQRNQLDLLKEMNAEHQRRHPHEGDLAARVDSFELAYRMQSAAPEAMNINMESPRIHDS